MPPFAAHPPLDAVQPDPGAPCRPPSRAAKRHGKDRATAKRRSREPDALDWQEAHSATEAVDVEVTVPGDDGATARAKVRTRRRKPDARLWGQMSPDQETAANRILEGWLLTGGVIGCRTMPFEHRARGRVALVEGIARQEYERAVTRAFKDWVRDCRREGIQAMDVIDYLAGGVTLDSLDERNGRRKGQARSILFAAFDAFTLIAARHFRQMKRER